MSESYGILQSLVHSTRSRVTQKYLKVGVKSVRQFIGGILYTKKLGFKKLFP